MDEITGVFLSWQFLLVGVVVWMIFAFFNQFLGPRLWQIKDPRWRKTLRFLEGIKLIWPPIFGFGLAWVPGMPRPDALEDSGKLTVAILFAVAGLTCQWIVKGVKKALEARGIDIDIDVDPREQKKRKLQ